MVEVFLDIFKKNTQPTKSSSFIAYVNIYISCFSCMLLNIVEKRHKKE
jgi:hypothetical protein